MPLMTTAFKITNNIALIGWLVLFSYPLWPVEIRTRIMTVIVVLLGLSYVYFIFLGKRHDAPGERPRGGFFTFGGVISLFKSPRVVLAGWIHYLAFDMMVGLFIVTDAAPRGLSHWLLLPALFMTLMFGPAGLLIYLAIRLAFGADVAGIGLI